MASNVPPPFSIASLRVDHDHDVTLQNLLHALTLNFELRARYRAFQFEASQDSVEEFVRVFERLWHRQGEEIHELLVALRRRLRELDRAGEEDDRR